MQIARQRRATMRIEMSPLIDCIFQLLVFFMLSSTFLTPAIRLTLPQADPLAPADDQQILVTVDVQGQAYVNRDPVPIDEIAARLRTLLADSPTKTVTLRGDEQMPYEYFVRALEAAQASGAVHVNVAHRPR